MTPWVESPTYQLDLQKPVFERLEVHADAFRKASLPLLAEVRREITSTTKYAGYAKYLGYLVDLRTGGRFRAEALALGRLGEVDWKELMLAAVSYEIVLSIFACSTAALATESGPVLARNMDFWPERALAQASSLLLYQREGRTESAVAGWPGSLGVVTGMSDKGFAIALNAVDSSEGIRKTGYPVMLFIRRVLEDAQGFEQAVQMLSEQKLMASALLTVVGSENPQRAVIERTPTRAAVRTPEGGEPLVTTNHYRLLDDEGDVGANILTRSSCGRFEALTEYACSEAFADPGDEALLFALSDGRVQQAITAQHIIARPSRNEMSVYVPRRLI